jgi:hypothetical protein
MSMITPGGGGNRRPSIAKPAAGAKPNSRGKADTTPGAEPNVDEQAEDSAAGAKSARASRATSASGAAAGARSTGAVSGASKASGTRPTGTRSTASRPSAGRPVAKGAAKGRKPIAPVKVNQSRNWGPIALFAVVVAVALGIVGYGAWRVYDASLTVSDRAASIDGVVNYREKDPTLSQQGLHAWGPLQYPQSPPVGGKHNYNWQNCNGDVYDAAIANEHAVHSLEHGAVWVTYNPDKLTKEQVDALAAKVRGKEYTFMSPFPGLDKAVSLQAWGYQLKVDSPTDSRVDQFITTLRHNAGIEKGASCSEGITATGTTPKDLGKEQQQQQQQQQQPGG